MIQKTKKIIVFADGGSRGNPGPAAAGIYLQINAENLRLLCGKYLGINTNNYAEYHGVLLGMSKARELVETPEETEIDFFLDSALVANQLNGLFKLKAENLFALYEKIKETEGSFKTVTYTHVPREKNKQADLAVNKALDRKADFTQTLNES